MKQTALSFDLLRFGSLKLRIAVVYAALFAVVLAAVAVIAGQALSRFAESTAMREMESNARVFDEILDLRARQMRSSADVLARDFGFREAAATQDIPTIESALESLRLRSNSDAAFVIGLDGEMLASSEARISNPASVFDKLDEGREYGALRLGNQLSLAAAAPVEAPDLIGWLVLAQPLNKAELDRLGELAATEIEASVILQEDLPDWMQAAELNSAFEYSDRERYLYQLSQIPTLESGIEPRLVLRHSLSSTLAQYSGLQTLLTLLAIAGIALAVGLSWRVARTVTAPLQKLDEATRLIGQGREVDLKPQSNDEIGRLTNSFNQMVTAIEDREREIIHAGLHDALTDLPNRKLFFEQLSQAASRLRGDDQLMVVYVDLDDFKLINDTIGHSGGDAMLRLVADRLRTNLPNALVARLGGDEFAILVNELKSGESLVAMAEEIQACFDHSVSIEGQFAECRASLGIAIAPSDGNDATTLIKNADLALYRAKSEGKSTYQFFEQSLDEQARLRRQTQVDLRDALRDGGFELNFQPLFNIAESRMNGFEALIRWNHPLRGKVPPQDFIPLAEETGLIVPIGEWVIREACHQAAQWPEDVSVAVNVSPRQFAAKGLTETILQALATSGLAPSRLEIEITESIFIADVEQTLATLHRLRDMGVRIALDDFGTGYSSLSYLRSFPFSKVKIDRSFIEDLANGNNAHAVIRAITTLADALDIETLAEGVELVEQLEVLRQEGCQNIQGYLFSKPVPASEVLALLADKAPHSQSKVA